jgi:hypothetical protein
VTRSLPPEFSNDRPLSSKIDDKLNRAPFAERIASVLRGLPNGTSLVVGIHGPWGDGKTSVLNMLQAHLDGDAATATVSFNPWRFGDEASMIAEFFGVLAQAISAKLKTKGEKVASLIADIGQYAGVLDDRIAKAGGVAAKLADPGLEELRRRVSTSLGNANKRIVVLVDDIDRLDKRETHTLFRLIKACADFPNVCYVLAFDDIVVAQSLGEQYGDGGEASGRAFLEKIIQIPLKLPVAMREDLRLLCFDQVERAIKAAGIELTREEVGEFISGLDRGISIRLDTPRAAKRYGNGLMFALPMLKDEVNIVDLLLIEAVRAFYPAVYEIIRANYNEFAGVESDHPRPGKYTPRGESLLTPVVDSLSSDEQEAIRSLLKDLFPRLGSAFGFGRYGSDWLSTWAKNKRICSPIYCPRYFSYSVPQSDVPDSEIDALFAKAAEDPAASAIGKDIVPYLSGRRAKRAIERMRQREAVAPAKAVPTLCLAIAANSKHIPNPPSLYSFAEPVSQASILISYLIRRLPTRKQRVMLAKRVIEAADPLWFGAEVLRWLHVANDPGKADRNTLTEEEVKVVRKAIVKRIKARAKTGEPMFSVDVPQERMLLFEWSEVEGRKPVQTHLSGIFKNDPKNVGLFLQAIAPRSWGQDDVLPRIGDLDGNQLKSISLIYDLDELAALIRKHLPGDFKNPLWLHDSVTPVDQRLAEQFMFVYNQRKEGGNTPDTPVRDSNPRSTSKPPAGTESDDEE